MFAILAVAGALLSNPPAKPSATATPSSGVIPDARAKPLKYCIEGTMTGSRIVRRDCRTRAEWLERNFDPLDPRE